MDIMNSGSTRDRIIETTSALLEAQGYHATGLNQIVTESGSPKGSLYHYFPGGKEELVAEAIRRASRFTAERISSGLTDITDPVEAIRVFVRNVAYYVEQSGFSSGGPLTTVALETVNTSERLNLACRAAYDLLQQVVQEKLVACGYSSERAAHLGTFIIAAIEGGILLSRVNHSGDPLRQVGEELAQLLRVTNRT
jgi:TetR/AcrR family transcriptional repressor of lmrAB and yxaGH operons